ncbi:unnamed protein product [Dracunculus medinensis]|uniref:SH2 domain-containing protein n=1 Tax=Dracunculus medinensis TaxID=318479 RepID=A0A158Q632_DRAME|nr:unnamed protein product [Dracunculus medinensis]
MLMTQFKQRLYLNFRRFNGQNSSKRERICEEDLVHKNMDRVEAERCLLNHEIGAFLIRRRDNDNLALSIRAVNGNLHIKLEFRNNRWVLGEGPSFNNILTIVNYYRTHELPVRGAERMILRTPILVSTVDSNMYA